jgi:hypothetical protein
MTLRPMATRARRRRNLLRAPSPGQGRALLPLEEATRRGLQRLIFSRLSSHL